MRIRNIASPNELISQNISYFSRNRQFIAAACFLFFVLFSAQAFGATKQTAPPKKSLKSTTRTSATIASNSKAKKVNPSTPKNSLPVKKATKPKTTLNSVKKTQSTQKTAATNRRNQSKAKSSPLVLSNTRSKGQSIAGQIGSDLPGSLKNEIDQLLGIRYRRGGQGQGGFDCSGLVHKVYADAFGIDLPHSSNELFNDASLAKVSGEALQTGDLLFFGPRRRHVNHVGIYLAGGYFFHAASSEGVTITRLDDNYWQSRWMSAKRVPSLDIQKGTLDRGLAKDVKKDSVALAFAGDVSTFASVQKVQYAEAGINVTDSTALQVSGFSVNALNDYAYSFGKASAAAMYNPAGDELQRGFRLSAVISPAEWFKLIPSVTQYSDGADATVRLGDYQRLGLETWMILPSSRMALFMAASAKNLEDMFERPLNASPDWESLNVALGLHYYLSESLRFSLKGSRSHGVEPVQNADSEQDKKVLDDVTFQMNYQF